MAGGSQCWWLSVSVLGFWGFTYIQKGKILSGKSWPEEQFREGSVTFVTWLAVRWTGDGWEAKY